jgi:hypothetical protein
VPRLSPSSGQVLVDNPRHVVAIPQDLPRFHPDHAVAALLDLTEVVRDEEHGPRLVPHFLDPVVALGPERGIAGGERLVDHQDLVALCRGDREPQALRHAGRVRAHRQVDEPAHPGEVDDVLVPGLDFLPRHAHREAAKDHVPLAGEVVEQRGVHAEQRGLAGRVYGAVLGGQQARDRAQQR